ncbi:MAG: alanine racemase C-terminal domain-containing protein, partial [Plesiomonas sp.]
LGPETQDKVGDEAILWGEGLPCEQVAQYTGTIAYELVTKLTPRVQMQYVGD